jgi:hypothetical protein
VYLVCFTGIKELEKLEERRCQKLGKEWTKMIKKKPEIGRRVKNIKKYI